MGKTIAEKIFASHLRDEPFAGTYVLSLDVVMCHEITTPIAISDLQWRGKDRVFDPQKIKAVIDHVTPAKDSKSALQGKILREWAARHAIADFFDIGRNGVCHALFPEKGFIRPGYTVIMGDSHTCTHGAFGAFAAGVGTTDLEVGILKGVCAFRQPKSVRVDLTGTLQRGVYAKDVILTVIKELTVNGATDQVIEFRGPAVDAMSMEERMTLSNMAIEAGGTSGICLPDATTVEYLWPFIAGEYSSKSAALGALAGGPRRGDGDAREGEDPAPSGGIDRHSPGRSPSGRKRRNGKPRRHRGADGGVRWRRRHRAVRGRLQASRDGIGGDRSENEVTTFPSSGKIISSGSGRSAAW